MTIVNTIFIAVHILSMAAIVGGWLANFKKTNRYYITVVRSNLHDHLGRGPLRTR